MEISFEGIITVAHKNERDYHLVTYLLSFLTRVPDPTHIFERLDRTSLVYLHMTDVILQNLLLDNSFGQITFYMEFCRYVMLCCELIVSHIMSFSV